MKMRSMFVCLGLSSACLPIPAMADIAGRYETRDGNAVIEMEMTVEADDSGNVRFQMAGSGGYYLFHDGELFVVEKDNDNFTVIRTADLFAVQQEAMARLGWKGADPSEGMTPPSFQFAPMGEEIVGGRAGIGYGIVSETNEEPMYASIVIGSDPELAPLGQAIAFAQQASVKGMGSMGSMLGMMNADMIELLQGGAPLRMLKIELTDVSLDPIPKVRFELPAEPLTINQLRAKIDVNVEPPPTLPPRQD